LTVIQPWRLPYQFFQRSVELLGTVIFELEHGGVELQALALLFAQVKAQA